MQHFTVKYREQSIIAEKMKHKEAKPVKRILIISLLICSLLFTACSKSSIGIIGGADGPTSIYVSGNGKKVTGQFGEQLEKKPVRMFNVDGDLYYDSGIISEITPRCGTMDGELKKAVKENEIPLKSGKANFEAEGYQNATSITKEVNIDGKWVIFKRYDLYDYTLDGLKYCYYIKGHLNNAAVDSEIIVLSENEDITFNDVYEPLLSSQLNAGEGTGKTIHNRILNDEWGITLYADDVTPNGMTLKIEQFGDNMFGEFSMGVEYSLETTVNDEWQEVKTKSDSPIAWTLVAYIIKKNDVTEQKINWNGIYGALKPGFYRLKKEIGLSKAGNYENKTYEVYFTVE